MVKKNKIFPFVIIALIIAVTIGSIAYFSDRASTNVSGNTGNLGISLDGSNIAFGNTYEEAFAIDAGSVTDFEFEVTNNNNTSVDMVVTILMEANNEMINSIPSDFDIYYSSDVTVSNGTYTIKEGAVPVGTRVMTDDKKAITYTLPVEVLSGSADFEERHVEWKHTNDTVITNASYNKLSDSEKQNYTKVEDFIVYDLVFIFNSDSMIDISDLEFTVTAEATQHREGKSWNDSEELKKYGKTNPIETNPNIEIKKTSDKQSYFPGETITYTITVTNTGDVSLKNVVVTEELEGGQFVEQEGVTINGLVATIEEIPVEGSVELTFLYIIPEN